MFNDVFFVISEIFIGCENRMKIIRVFKLKEIEEFRIVN